jgi:3-oxoacyl-[acyl-carrier protein] reductase
MKTFGLEGKTAIVTGAAQGMGRAIALALLEEKANVVAADLNGEKLRQFEQEAKSQGWECMAIQVDVSQSEGVRDLVGRTLERFGSIDILVNNAGICPRTDFESITEEEWDRVLSVNLKSVFMLSQAVYVPMKERRYGKIINLGSAAGKLGGIQVGAHYSASKAGIICLTKTIALNGAKYNINANVICPGVIDTQMTTAISPEKIENYKKMIPLGRIGQPADVANAALFLASDLSSYLTGEVMDVNGGFVMD